MVYNEINAIPSLVKAFDYIFCCINVLQFRSYFKHEYRD